MNTLLGTATKTLHDITKGITLDRFPGGLPVSIENDIARAARRFYNMSPKDIVRRLRDQSHDAAVVEKKLSRNGITEYENVLGVLWSPPNLRRTLLIGYYKTDDNDCKNRLLPIEPAVIGYYLKTWACEKEEFNLARMRVHPHLKWWWAEIDTEVTRMPCEARACLRILPELFIRLERFNTSYDHLFSDGTNDIFNSPIMEELDQLGEAVFAVAGLTGCREVFDAAIHVNNSLQHCFSGMEWQEDINSKEDLGYVPLRRDNVLMRKTISVEPLWDFMDACLFFANDFQETWHTGPSILSLPEIVKLWKDTTKHAMTDADLVKYMRLIVGASVSSIKHLNEDAVQDLLGAGVAPPYDPVKLADKANRFLERTDSLDYLARMNSAVHRLLANSRQLLSDTSAVTAIQNKEKSLKDHIQANGAADIKRITQLTSDIEDLRKREEQRLTVLREYAILPEPPAEPPPAGKSPTPVPETGQHQIDEQLLAENIAQAGLIRGLQNDLHTERARVHSLEIAAQSTAKARAGDNGTSSVLKNMARVAITHGKMTPEGVLYFIRAICGEDRILVLDSAMESARKSGNFRAADRLFDLLMLLAGDYRDRLASGRPDTDARHILGNSYHANESESVTDTQRLARMRTFRYEGRDVPMYAHLSIGVGTDTASTIRAHFFWDGAKKRIVLGYCGPHLPTVKTP